MSAVLAFAATPEHRDALIAEFHARPEIRWFGFRGAFAGDQARVSLAARHDGVRGGAGGAAVNGGVIAAAFDAAAALVAQGHHEGAVATIDLAVRYLRPAPPDGDLHVVAIANATSRDLTFVAAELVADQTTYATATALVKTLRGKVVAPCA